MDGTKASFVVTVVLALHVLSFANSAQAHFVWLDSASNQGQTQALLFFSEGPHERDYHLPESIADAVLHIRHADGQTIRLASDVKEGGDFVGLQARVSARAPFVLQSVTEYGVYHGTLLTYYAKRLDCPSHAEWAKFKPSSELQLEIMPAWTARGIQCTVLWQGKPLAQSDITLTRAEGEPVNKTTGKDGRVIFELAKGGKLGLYASHVDKTVKGELDGTSYTSATHYATLTVDAGRSKSTDATSTSFPAQTGSAPGIPELPEPISSFGAVTHNGWLYVYGGHSGGAHEHSRDNLSERFLRLKLDGGKTWEKLPMQTPLQGLALVAHGDYLYRVGGMNARNAPDEDDDLHSVSEFSRFDPESKTWDEMPPLPEPRSSHDAVVIGDTLYVVGGWVLEGPGHGEWHETAWAFPLRDDSATWQSLPPPPFKRRALAASHWKDRLIVLGGMTADSEVSRRLDIWDLATQRWSTGPDFPGDGIHGFGISAWNLGGHVYASGLAGVVYRLSEDGTAWLDTARLATPRFFHRLMPRGNGTLLAVAGASMEKGHLADIELLQVK